MPHVTHEPRHVSCIETAAKVTGQSTEPPLAKWRGHGVPLVVTTPCTVRSWRSPNAAAKVRRFQIMRGIPTRGRGQSRRQTSERALLDAFEAMLQRHGPSGVGVNAVLDSAGVGKRLLYEYFGDLAGLAAAWSSARSDPLALAPRRAALARRLASLGPRQKLAAAMTDYATQLREHPWATQVLLAELAQPSTLGHAMREIRLELGRGYEDVLVEAGAFATRESLQLALVLQAAATYLAMRARFAPDYNGIDLASPEGWKAALEALATFGQAARKPAGRAKRRPVAREASQPATRGVRARKPRGSAGKS